MASEGSLSTNNKIKDKGAITANVLSIRMPEQLLLWDVPHHLTEQHLTGKIALIDRGNCDFVPKVKNAQNAGAMAVLIADNVDGQSPILMGGTDNTITIPAFSILKSVGDSIKTYRNQ